LIQSENSKQAVGPFIFIFSDYTANQQPTTTSVFGNVEFKPTDALTAYAGLRYSSQDRDFSGCMGDAGDGSFARAVSFIASNIAGAPREIAPGSCVTLDPATFEPVMVESSLDEDNWSWRVGLSWESQDDLLLYGNITRGFKSGGYSLLPGLVPATFDPVTQESLLSYEIGFKTPLFDAPVRLSGAAFYYDYSDKQLVGFGTVPVFGVVPQLVNIPASRVYGAEFELSGRPMPNLQLSAGVVYVDSKVEENPVPPAQTLTPFGTPTSYIGESFPNTPEWQVVGDAEQTFGASGSVSYFLGGSVAYRSEATAAFGGLAQFDIDSYTILDIRAGVQERDGTWRVQLYGRNVTDEYYWVNVGRPIDSVSRYAGKPATYGVMATFRY
jgi:outer membrane receptor protein involved in Fe transport